MELQVGEKSYKVEIEKKKTNRNTYIRVKKDLTILVTTNFFTSNREIEKLLKENYKKIISMLEVQIKRQENNEGFFYLGKKYDIVYVTYCDFSLGDTKVFMKKDYDIDKWYKKQAKEIFLNHLDKIYENFQPKIPYPSLKVRKMTSRWGVCNTRLKCVTLNLELIKRDLKYLDYVIVHELSHLVYPNHSKDFWQVVENNMPEYKKYRKEMKEF